MYDGRKNPVEAARELLSTKIRTPDFLSFLLPETASYF